MMMMMMMMVMIIRNVKYRTNSNNTLYLFKVLEAAICCEEHGIFHRDIKPLNIIMNAADWSEVKLTDFGLSCALHSEPYREFRGKRNPRRVTWLLGKLGTTGGIWSQMFIWLTPGPDRCWELRHQNEDFSACYEVSESNRLGDNT